MKVVIKKGDVFCIKIDNKSKKYIQYITNDLTQLNSAVIRAFSKSHPLESNSTIQDILSGDIDFYAHCTIKLAVKLNLWEKIGNSQSIGSFDNILFRDTDDYGHKEGEEPTRFSNNWFVWKINDNSFTHVGKLLGQNKKAFIGIVYNPLDICELLKGNKNPINYPDYE